MALDPYFTSAIVDLLERCGNEIDKNHDMPKAVGIIRESVRRMRQDKCDMEKLRRNLFDCSLRNELLVEQNAELRKPNGYWCAENPEEWYESVEELASHGPLGAVVEVIPHRTMENERWRYVPVLKDGSPCPCKGNCDDCLGVNCKADDYGVVLLDQAPEWKGVTE